MPRSIRLALSALAILGLVPGVASAHAFLDHANPAVGSSLPASPGSVRIWFTQALEPAFSTIEVLDQNGKRVDADDVQVDAADKTQLYATLKPLPPGVYKVFWRVVSVDTHATEGKFTFDVGQ